MERDWLEKIYLESINKIAPDLEDTEENAELISKVVADSLPEVIELFEKKLIPKSQKIRKANRRDLDKFKKRLVRRWKSAFNQLEIFIAFNLEYGYIVSESYRNNNKEDIKFETLLRLHARACQIASEILELMKNGFADGALARWRSLYEISIIANFLVDKTNDLSQRYLDYYFIENYYETLEYQKNCTKLGYEPLPANDIQEATDLFNEQKNKHGEDFTKPYGWIGEYLPKKKWNFAGIEETIEFKFLRSFYKLANNYVHSGPKGFIFKLGTYTQGEVMLAGPSNYGFADPGQNTGLSLLHTTITLSEFEHYLEDSIYIQIGMNMLYRLSEEFVNLQNQIEVEEQEL